MTCDKERAGWTGSILKVDLGTGEIEIKNSYQYVRKFIGGKGLNHRLAWEELTAETKAFSPDNCLFISVGPLTGTAAPSSGRATVGGVSAQSFPEMYAHSGVGGWFPAALKYAGYDAIIITGISPFECYLYIDDDIVDIKRAQDLWGLGTYDTQRVLKQRHGQQVHTLCIGPAGENQSRIGVLLTDTENAAGQGGFGGVAGKKKLKAICVRGSGEINVACPEALVKLRKDYMNTRQTTPLVTDMPFTYDEQATEDLPFRRNRVSCSHACDRHCFWSFHDVPGVTRPSLRSGKWGCVGEEVIGWHAPFHVKWPLWGEIDKEKVGMVDGPISKASAQAGFEISRLINQYGVNAWDLIAGMVPWLVMASRVGLIDEHKKLFKDILPVNADDPEWWVKLIKTIAYPQTAKSDVGKQLFQGNYRTIKYLVENVDKGFEKRKYKDGKKFPTKISLHEAWGYAGHWSGRGIHSCLEFPCYLIRALAWMTGTRDPMDDTHIRMKPEWEDELTEAIEKALKDDKLDRLYKLELLPKIAIWNENRSELKSSLTLCDWAFPNKNHTELESQLFSAVTGIETGEEELDRIGARLKNMQRALLIRFYDREFKTEFKTIMKWFRRRDGTRGIRVNPRKFEPMVQKYYELRGWDHRGRPTKETLYDLGLRDVAEELIREGKIGKARDI